MATTPLLNVQQVTANQNNKETTINDGFVIFEGSTNASISIDMSGGDVTLTTSQYTRYFRFDCSGLTAARKLTVPLDVGGGSNTSQRIFSVRNSGVHDLTVGGATGNSVVLSAGSSAVLASDGTSIFNILTGSSVANLSVQEDGVGVASGVNTINFLGEVAVSDEGGGEVNVTVSSASSEVTVENKVANYALVLADAGSVIRMNVASANDLTVPTNASVAFPVGTIINVRQAGAGQTTLVASGGVTINSPATLKLTGQHSSASLLKVAADEWDLTGDLEAV